MPISKVSHNYLALYLGKRIYNKDKPVFCGLYGATLRHASQPGNIGRRFITMKKIFYFLIMILFTSCIEQHTYELKDQNKFFNILDRIHGMIDLFPQGSDYIVIGFENETKYKDVSSSEYISPTI